MKAQSALSAERTSGGGPKEPGGSPGSSPWPVTTRPGTLTTFVALYRLLMRSQVTLARVLGIGALGALAVMIGLFARADDNSAQAAADAVSSYGLAVLVPLATLWLGTSAVGDLVEDRLLVYLWLKPVARWQLPAAAVLATFSVVFPLTALPLVLSAVVAGSSEVAWATLLAAPLATLAYSGVFVAAGIWFRRAIWWGLAFVLIWENAVAYIAEGTSRVTIVGWASSVLGRAEGVDVQLDAGSASLALVVLPTIASVAWLVATWRYRRADID
jgi:ABC-2 type transport system permease protein